MCFLNLLLQITNHFFILSRYLPSEFVGDEGFSILATPQMLDTFSSALFVEFDVTYDEIKGLRYVAHAVAFNHLLMTFQPVAKILMSRITSGAYRKAVKKLLELMTNFHPEFKNGKNLALWQVDYSLAQRDALEDSIGNNAFIRAVAFIFNVLQRKS